MKESDDGTGKGKGKRTQLQTRLIIARKGAGGESGRECVCVCVRGKNIYTKSARLHRHFHSSRSRCVSHTHIQPSRSHLFCRCVCALRFTFNFSADSVFDFVSICLHALVWVSSPALALSHLPPYALTCRKVRDLRSREVNFVVSFVWQWDFNSALTFPICLHSTFSICLDFDVNGSFYRSLVRSFVRSLCFFAVCFLNKT